MKLKSLIIFLIIITSLNSCGYKKMNTESVKLFTLDNLYITGEKSLNFIIKNKLSLYTNNKSQSLLDIKIKLFKERGVKEKKSNKQGGRPQGLTKRTVERYKKVFLKYEALRSKNTSKTKAELYELLAAIDYDGKTFTRRTIRNIIEDKKYNLISTR